MPKRILIIEDDVKISKAIKRGLEQEGYVALTALSGEDGFFQIHSQPCDLILLDVLLPGRSGIEILAALRKAGRRTPILMLTALDSLEDKVSGLDAGADDYLGKPFAFPELLARIRALLRRGGQEELLLLRTGDLELDLAKRKVVRSGRNIELTTKEFELLEYLLRNKGHVVSREMLAVDVWKEPNRATPIDNIIDVHMTRLRRKVDEPFEPKLLKTVRGVGFMISADSP
ncbi:MAG: winged-helix transcriptional response regulator [Fibrobacteres bacterium]|nr:winged-helix transcriptional response regulator [Fibrobacterota bacterium]